ncbi:MAG: hypothetical protein KIH62_004155 [Candidatus Kerfeldbacteria bacterium]|nr:hypothetical protein [Candidatus Kerfeldbacteria bacterium]
MNREELRHRGRHPEDQDVERLAIEMREAFDTAVTPSDVAALIEATIGADDSSLEHITSTFVRSEEGIERIQRIEERVVLYCGTSTAPSEYAQLLLRSARGEQLDDREREYMRRIQRYVITDLAPHILALQGIATDAALHAHVHTSELDALAHPQGIWNALQSGRIREQRTLSLFGVMAQARERDAELAVFDPEATELPRETNMEWVTQIDPLGPDTQVQLWSERCAVAKTTLPEEIQLRSYTLAYELEAAADALPDIEAIHAKMKGEKPLEPHEIETMRRYEAYITLAEWVDEHAEMLHSNMKPGALASFQSRLHFAHSSAEEVLALLNAAEVVKENDPLLFLRMMGVRPERGFAQDAAQRGAQRSDLFGSVFHIALHRSFHLETSEASEGMQIFHSRVATLFHLDTQVPQLLSISDAQMAEIEKRYCAQAKGVTSGIGAVALTAGFLALVPGYTMRRDLELMLSAVSLEEHRRILQALEVGSPREVLRTLKELPADRQGDPDILRVLRRRLGAHATTEKENSFLFELPKLFYFARSRHGFEPKGDSIYLARSILFELWSTSPSEALLSEEFLLDVERVAEEPSEQHVGLWRAIMAHPDIQHHQWRAATQHYREATQKEREGILLPWEKRKRRDIDKSWHAIFSKLSLADIRRFNSKVFAVREIDGFSDATFFAPTAGDEIPQVLQYIYGDGVLVREEADATEQRTEYFHLLQRAFAPPEFVRRYGQAFVEEQCVTPGHMRRYMDGMPHAEAKALLAALVHPNTRYTRLNWVTDEPLFTIGTHDTQGKTYEEAKLDFLLCMRQHSAAESARFLERVRGFGQTTWQRTVLELAREYDVPLGDAQFRGNLHFWSIIAFAGEYAHLGYMATGATKTRRFPHQRLRILLNNAGLLDQAVFNVSPNELPRISAELELSLQVDRDIETEYAIEHNLEFGVKYAARPREAGVVRLQPFITMDSHTLEWYRRKQLRMQEYLATLPEHMRLEREAAQKELELLNSSIGRCSSR